MRLNKTDKSVDAILKRFHENNNKMQDIRKKLNIHHIMRNNSDTIVFKSK